MRGSKIDRNQPEIVGALIQSGYTVLSLAPMGNGCPDLLVGGPCGNLLLEIKNGDKWPSQRRLNPKQVTFHETWLGPIGIAETTDEALALADEHCR